VTSNKLRIAGFLAMTSAILSIPLLLLSNHFNENDTMGYALFLTFMQIAGLGLFIYLNSFLKKFLNLRFSFHEVDNYIDFMITINIFLCVAGIAGIFLTTLTEPLAQFSLLLIVSFGIGQLLFGIKLFKLPDSLQGMLKPLCFITMLTGLLIATIFLLPIAAFTGAIADVMLGTIFFQAREISEAEDAG
jgi:hypothetical protein